ncbi:MAG: hypothetical protein ABFD50_21310 [Smithella sp.]
MKINAILFSVCFTLFYSLAGYCQEAKDIPVTSTATEALQEEDDSQSGIDDENNQNQTNIENNGTSKKKPSKKTMIKNDTPQSNDTLVVGEDRQKEKKSIQVAPVEKGGSLLPSGRFVIEPFFEYDHVSTQNVSISGFTIFESILIGQVSVQKVTRDLYIPGLTLRLGLKDTEFNVKIPYVYRHDNLTVPVSGSSTAQLTEKGIDDNGLGDIEAYMYYHLLKEKESRPDIILRLGAHFPTGKDPYGLTQEYIPELGVVMPVEFPTGTGHYGASLGFTLAKSVDPTVLFFNAAYYYNFSRSVGVQDGQDYGDIKLGDSIEFGFGLVFALQEKLSLNFSYNQRITQKTTQNDIGLANTGINAISFNVGATYVSSPSLTVDMQVALGLSQDAPAVSVLLRLPFSIQF